MASSAPPSRVSASPPGAPKLVAIGASLGGTAALGRVLCELPAAFPLPVVVVLHRGKRLDDALVSVLGASTALSVCEPDDREPIEPGRVYVAPGDYHLLVERGRFAISTDPPVHNARPSIDVLLDSAAESYGDGVVAVVLTGANADGAAGAKSVKEHGGALVVQDPDTAEARAMPDAALAAAPADHVAAPDAIGRWLRELCEARRAEGGTA